MCSMHCFTYTAMLSKLDTSCFTTEKWSEMNRRIVWWSDPCDDRALMIEEWKCNGSVEMINMIQATEMASDKNLLASNWLVFRQMWARVTLFYPLVPRHILTRVMSIHSGPRIHVTCRCQNHFFLQMPYLQTNEISTSYRPRPETDMTALVWGTRGRSSRRTIPGGGVSDDWWRTLVLKRAHG